MDYGSSQKIKVNMSQNNIIHGSSSDYYDVELMRRRDSSKGVGYLQYKGRCHMFITSESLTIRDCVSGSLLVDFPRVIIDSFHLVANTVIRINHVNGETAIAIKIQRDKLISLVKELKLLKYKGIKNAIDEATTGHKRQRLNDNTKRDVMGLNLPDLTDELVAFHVMNLMIDPRFVPFVAGLERIVERFLSMKGAPSLQFPPPFGQEGMHAHDYSQSEVQRVESEVATPVQSEDMSHIDKFNTPVRSFTGAAASIQLDSGADDDDCDIFFGS